MTTRTFRPLMILLIAFAVTGSSLAQDEQDEYAVKVGYLYHFCNYVRWPKHVQKDSIVVGVIGPALKMQESLDTIRDLNGQTVANRKIILREISSMAKYEPCDMIFVSGDDATYPELMVKLLEKTEKEPVLIVTEQIDGLKRGATINFVRVGKTVKFEIKKSTADKVNLVLNAKLMRLAVNASSNSASK